MIVSYSDTDAADRAKPLFADEINGWDSWGRIFQDLELFRPLIWEICRIHKLLFQEPEHLTPGTNAVFAVGPMVFKIYAPAEAGFDQSADCDTELFSLRRCRDLGISVPDVIATGILHDRYDFRYLVQSRCSGMAFREIWPMAGASTEDGSVQAKADFGRKLRALLIPMNTPCGRFNDIDVIQDSERARRWDPFPANFREDRLHVISELCESVWRPETYVFVHGDLNEDNILIDGDRISLLDFGDACLAPAEYEHALVATELFRLDSAFLQGYFREYYGSDPALSLDELAKTITQGILIHDFGGDVLRQRFGLCEELHRVADLQAFIRSKL